MTQQWETQQEEVCAMHVASQFLATQQCTDEDAARIIADWEASTPTDGLYPGHPHSSVEDW